MEDLFNKMVSKIGNLDKKIIGYGKMSLLDNIENEEVKAAFNKLSEVNIKFSLTTDEMIDLDNKFLEEDEQTEFAKSYRPYFFEFYAKISVEKLKEYNDYIGKWINISLVNSIKDGEKNYINGVAIFSASPLKRTRKYLLPDTSGLVPENEIAKLEKRVREMINSQVVQSSDVVCTKVMEKINEFDRLNFTVYNVGQGNFIKLQFHGDKSAQNTDDQDYVVLFDIGVTVSINPEESSFIADNLEEFKELKPSAIILSHWDTDHILGITNMDQERAFGGEIAWIVPDPADIDEGVSRSVYILLAKLLKTQTRVAVVREDEQRVNEPVCATKDKTVFLWKGLGNKGVYQKPEFTSANNIGLILQIVKNGKALLFPGDCEYTRMPEPCIRSYNFMIASHHGAAQEFPSGLMASGFGRCIVSFGSNLFDHPKIQCLLKLRRLGYVYIGFTDYVKQFSFCFPSKKELAEIVSIQQAIHELENGKPLTCCLCLDNFGMDALKILRSDIFI